MKEITLKQWIADEAQRIGITESGVIKRMYKNGQYRDLKKRYRNKRTVLVPDKHTTPSNGPHPEEITHKAFCIGEAERLGVTPHAIQMRILRGRYQNLKVRKVNRHVVYVKWL